MCLINIVKDLRHLEYARFARHKYVVSCDWDSVVAGLSIHQGFFISSIC